MTRLCWWLVDTASRLLESDERDAVRGDLAETGARGGSALGEVLGLVVRRQTALWLDVRPWLAVVGVVVPIGFLLSHASRWLADSSAIYAFLYLNNWTWSFIEIPGARRDIVRLSTYFLLDSVALVGWSWTSGFVLGALSRRTAWITASLFFLVVMLGTLGATTTGRAGNAVVFSLPFYAVVFPRLVRTFLVLLPAWWGMRRSVRRTALPVLPTIVAAVAIMLLTAWVAPSLEGSVTFGRNAIPVDGGPDRIIGTADDPRTLWPLSLLLLWPSAFIVTTMSWRRWRGSSTRGTDLA
jgi:hypothetical protein